MFALVLLFSICTLAGAIWIALLAFQEGEIAFGVFSIVCGIVAIVYGIQRFDDAKIPLGLMAVGIVGNIITRVALAQ